MNQAYQRSTTASRRAARTTKFLHVSKTYAPILHPITQAITGYRGSPGSTFNVGSNALKRANRRASVKARVAVRSVRPA